MRKSSVDLTRFSPITLETLDAEAGKPVEEKLKLEPRRRQEWLLCADGKRRKAMQRMTPDEATIRFWARVQIGKPDECWPWHGDMTQLGYGVTPIGPGRKRTSASRAAFYMVYGIAADKFVLHRCDNPSCVNPRHLYAGDQSQNLIDCVNRGRLPATKMTPEQVKEVRRLYATGNYTQSSLARHLQIPTLRVHTIVSGRAWSWLT